MSNYMDGPKFVHLVSVSTTAVLKPIHDGGSLKRLNG